MNKNVQADFWNSVYESTSEIDRICVAFGTYHSPERLIATIEDLLSGEFSFQDLCVVGAVRSLFQSLTQLQKQSVVDAGQLSLLSHTESFFDSHAGLESGVGSKGRSLSVLKRLMTRRRNCTDESRNNEYSIDNPELKKQIVEGNLTLFVCTSDPDLLVPALRILIRRSSFNVHSHEFRS